MDTSDASYAEDHRNRHGCRGRSRGLRRRTGCRDGRGHPHVYLIVRTSAALGDQQSTLQLLRPDRGREIGEAWLLVEELAWEGKLTDAQIEALQLEIDQARGDRQLTDAEVDALTESARTLRKEVSQLLGERASATQADKRWLNTDGRLTPGRGEK